ncbi:MAG: spore coat U domain-containing protein [Pseudomonadota bacterium]
MSVIARPLKTLTLIGGLLLAWLGSTTPAYALSCNASIGNVNFGNINVLSSANPLATASAPVAVTCSRSLLELGGDATVCLYLGDGSGGWDGSSERYLKNGTSSLGYNLYKDAARSQIWGSLGIFGASGPKRYVFNSASTLIVLGGSATINDTIYASVNPNQNTDPVGPYSSSFSSTHTLLRFANGNVACPGSGGSSISTFNVTATVVANCVIDAQDLNFGTASSLSSNRDQTSALSVTCTNAAPWSIGLSNGANFSGTRRMRLASTTNYIGYTLFRNSTRTQAWGTGTGNEATGTGTGSSQALTVYGRVPPQAALNGGTYVDTVIATVTF